MPDESRRLFQYHLSQILMIKPSLVSVLLNRLLEFGNEILSLRDDVLCNSNVTTTIRSTGNLTGSALKKSGLTERLIGVHVDALNSIRESLSELCFKLAKHDLLHHVDIVALIHHISLVELTDPTWRLLLCSLVCSIQGLIHSAPESQGAVEQLAAVFAAMNAGTSHWMSTSLQSIILIQFCVMLKYLREIVPRVEDVLGTSESLESKIEKQLAFSPFQFMLTHLLSFKTAENVALDLAEDDRVFFDIDIQEQILTICHVFVSSFLGTMGRVVRNMKSVAEDLPPQPIEGTKFGNSEYSVNPVSSFESLLLLIAHIHRHRPESGLPFWTNPSLSWVNDRLFCRI
jgi:hypothetical protein